MSVSPSAPPEDAPDPRDLESSICDLVLAAKLASSHLEGLLKPLKEGNEMVVMFEWQAELAMFAVYEVAHRAKALEAEFFAAVYPGQGGEHAG